MLAWWRRNRRGIGSDTQEPHPGERTGWFVVVGAGVVLPIALIAALFVDLGHLRDPDDAGAGGHRDAADRAR